MQTDIEMLRDGGLMVVQAEAMTEAGTEFVDAYQTDGGELVVVDSGRIILQIEDEEAFTIAATRSGLKVADA